MKLPIKNKLFSGALQFTIFIGAIIPLLLTGLVLLENTHNFFIEQSKATIENIELANSGINYLLNNDKPISDTITIEALNGVNQNVKVYQSRWGIFEKAIVKTSHRKKIFFKAALFGAKMQAEIRPTLYLEDHYKPLVVVGKTLLKGMVYIPSQGIKPGYIAGESYYGKDLILGTIKKSNVNLPKLSNNYQQELASLLKNSNFTLTNFLAKENLAKVSNSFLNPTKIYYSKSVVELDNMNITGNIIIKSDQLVRIKKTAILKDIIIMAPEVQMEDQVQGTFQVIANKKINVGKNCKLNYPSALVLIQDNDSNLKQNDKQDQTQITIDAYSQVRGTICYFKSIKEKELDFKTQLLLEKTAIVKGEVYCQGNFELKGEVVGSVFTEQFIVNAAGSVFINHIYNGQINGDNFPQEFCGILFEDNPKGVAKWMY